MQKWVDEIKKKKAINQANQWLRWRKPRNLVTVIGKHQRFWQSYMTFFCNKTCGNSTRSFYKFQNLKSSYNLPSKHARNLIGRLSFGQSHIDRMSSTSTPVKKACDNVFDLTNLSIQVRKGELTEAAMLYSSTKGSFC